MAALSLAQADLGTLADDAAFVFLLVLLLPAGLLVFSLLTFLPVFLLLAVAFDASNFAHAWQNMHLPSNPSAASQVCHCLVCSVALDAVKT